MRSDKHLFLHLFLDMRGILRLLGDKGVCEANDLSHIALAVLASYGAVDIVSGVVSLTSPIGIDLLAKVEKDEARLPICDVCNDHGCGYCKL